MTRLKQLAGGLALSIDRAISWLDQPGSRTKVYKYGRVVVPLLVTAGFLSSGDARIVLLALGVLAGGGGLHLAARHAPTR